MRRVLFLLLALFVWRCASPAPEPAPAPVPTPAPVTTPAPAAKTIVQVTASALNVRREPSTEAAVVGQVKKGERLEVLVADESWTKVRLANGESGWVASRFVSHDGASRATTSSPARRRSGCPPDSDYAFRQTPPLSFSESGAHGLVVVEAHVNAKGDVTSTKVVSNGTGDETLAFLAEREIKSAKFSPPIRNCVPKAFIFTYRRTF